MGTSLTGGGASRRVAGALAGAAVVLALAGSSVLPGGCSGGSSGGAGATGPGGQGSSGGGAQGGNTGGGVAAAGDAGGAASPAGDGGGAQASSGGSADGGFSRPTGPQAEQAGRLFVEGDAAFRRGDFPSAARAFRQAYDAAPAPEMAFNVARVYERMGEVGDAVRYFEIVLRANPTAEQRADIDRRIASLRAYEQRRRDGIAQPPASRDELSAEGLRWFQIGVTSFNRRRYSEARIAFEQAHSYLNTPELFFNLAATYERLNQIDQAIENFREYQQSRRGTPEEAEIQRRIDRLQQRR